MFRDKPDFRDRRDAGRQLARALLRFRSARPLILALPRGGVPVAYEIARALGAQLDLLFVRKLGAPGNEELAIGALVDGADPQLVLNEDIIRQLPLPPGYIDRETERQLAEIERRRRAYLGDTAAIPAAGRTVIIVDDGIATGATVRAALRGIGRARPARLVLAIPVAPPDVLDALRVECDEIVCLAQPSPFYAVGAHYGRFHQTYDEEVIRLLDEARNAEETAPSLGARLPVPPPPSRQGKDITPC